MNHSDQTFLALLLSIKCSLNRRAKLRDKKVSGLREREFAIIGDAKAGVYKG